MEKSSFLELWEKHNLKHICKNPECGKKIKIHYPYPVRKHSRSHLITIKYRNKVPQYCNAFCMRSHRLISGKAHIAYKDGSGRGYNYKKTRRFLDNATCEVCASDERLIVHHKDKNPQNNKLSNITILCISCHSKHHWRKRRKYKNKKECQLAQTRKAKQKLYEQKEDVFFKKFGTKKFYRATDITKKNHITREYVRQLRVSGRLPHLKHGGIYLYLNDSY